MGRGGGAAKLLGPLWPARHLSALKAPPPTHRSNPPSSPPLHHAHSPSPSLLRRSGRSMASATAPLALPRPSLTRASPTRARTTCQPLWSRCPMPRPSSPRRPWRQGRRHQQRMRTTAAPVGAVLLAARWPASAMPPSRLPRPTRNGSPVAALTRLLHVLVRLGTTSLHTTTPK